MFLFPMLHNQGQNKMLRVSLWLTVGPGPEYLHHWPDNNMQTTNNFRMLNEEVTVNITQERNVVGETIQSGEGLANPNQHG